MKRLEYLQEKANDLVDVFHLACTTGSNRPNLNPVKRKRHDMSHIECYACHSFGHYHRHCPMKKKGAKM
jgi:hypothetical protein